MTDHTVPPIGMRMIKTAAAVLICLLVSMAVDREDMRIYSSIAALLCVQPYAEDTKRWPSSGLWAQPRLCVRHRHAAAGDGPGYPGDFGGLHRHRSVTVPNLWSPWC